MANSTVAARALPAAVGPPGPDPGDPEAPREREAPARRATARRDREVTHLTQPRAAGVPLASGFAPSAARDWLRRGVRVTSLLSPPRQRPPSANESRAGRAPPTWSASSREASAAARLRRIWVCCSVASEALGHLVPFALLSPAPLPR